LSSAPPIEKTRDLVDGRWQGLLRRLVYLCPFREISLASNPEFNTSAAASMRLLAVFGIAKELHAITG
jgi:hypothetical protein